MYEAMVPLFSSDLRATMTESPEPGRNLNDEKPWSLLRGCVWERELSKPFVFFSKPSVIPSKPSVIFSNPQ